MHFSSRCWALILGGSSGFGLATARKLAHHGMSLCVVHRDRRGALPPIEAAFAEIRTAGGNLISFNADALDGDVRNRVLDQLRDAMGEQGRVRVLLHSIAFGNLKPIADHNGAPQSCEGEAAGNLPPPGVPVAERNDSPLLARGPGGRSIVSGSTRSAALLQLARAAGIEERGLAAAIDDLFAAGVDELATLVSPPPHSPHVLDEEDLARTIHSMGTSIVAWAQDILARGMFAADARVFGLTSEGNSVAWRGYAAVAAAKAALESVCRAMAVELAAYGIRSNVIQAGVTDTAALRAIPGSAQLKAQARLRNPFRRLTVPEDIANAIFLLSTDEASWINGEVIRVDGGEHVSGGIA
jgi:NAD(P)-dependent dehydrogenase (short-subunit alcohol dehydrogenase family)